MVAEIRFRAILPVAQCVCAALFGGFGLWMRDFVLGQPFFHGTLWATTARFHVWPYPYKFVAVANFPALMVGLLAGLPIDAHWRGLPEWVDLSPTLLFIALLWYWIGRWFDRRWSRADGPPSTQKYPQMVLLLFTLLCAGAANVEIESTSDYLLSGALIWMVAGCVLAGSSLYSKFRRPLAAQ